MRAPGPMRVRSAQRFFAICFFLVTLATFTAVGGIGSAQSKCHNDSMVEYWTPAYQMFLTTGLKNFKCVWYQIGSWWALGIQMGFWLSILSSWVNGFMERHMATNFGAGIMGSIMSIMAALYLMSEGAYYTGSVITDGTVAFWAFFCIPLFNGFLALAYCELMWAHKHATPSGALLPTPRDNASDATQSSSLGEAKDRRLTDESMCV